MQPIDPADKRQPNVKIAASIRAAILTSELESGSQLPPGHELAKFFGVSRMLFGRPGSRSLDHADFLPIFEAAAALNVPLYLHPQSPPAAVRSAYYAGLGDPLDAGMSTFGLG